MSASSPPPIHDRAATAIIDLLDRQHLMTVAFNRPDGWPQATTVGYLNEGLNLYFIVARTSQKFANLQADDRASVAIRCDSGASGDGMGVSMGGRVFEVVDPAVIERLNRQVTDRYPGVHVYCPSGDAVAVLQFRPTVISAVGVVQGRSDAETFTIGPTESGSVSKFF